MRSDFLSEFYFAQKEPQQSCLLALRSLILQDHPSLSETLKYGMPCFCVGKKPICYLWVERKTAQPYILFVEGRNLHYPELEAGGRARMKILRVDPEQDIPYRLIRTILREALSLVANK